MEFLRRLAPARAGDTSRAVAAMPSRFAVEQPLRAIEAPPAGVVAAAVDEVRSASVSLPPVRAGEAPAAGRTAIPDASSIGRRREGPPSAMPEDPPPRSGEIRRPLSALTRPSAERWLEPTTRPSDARHPVAGRLDLATEPVRGHLPRPAVPAAECGAPTIASSDTPIKRQANVRLTVAQRLAAPLSAAALGTRLAPSAPPRAVIHVTIDRLEVRAPARAERTPLPARRRAGSPTVSLSDYLRGRRPGPSGGTP